MSSADEPLGRPAEEARRLVEALGAWASTRLSAPGEQLATDSAECQLCPVCQLISVLRGDRPEVMARVGEAWAAFLAILGGHGHPAGPAPAEDAVSPAGRTASQDPQPDPGQDSVRPVWQIRVD